MLYLVLGVGMDEATEGFLWLRLTCTGRMGTSPESSNNRRQAGNVSASGKV